MVKLSVDLNEPKEDSSKTDKAAQNVVIYGSRTPKSLTLEIHHGGWFTPTPSRSYIGGQVSSVNVVDIDEFCLHDLKDMVVKLGYGVEDLMYCHFLIPSLGLDYGLQSLNFDADVLEMSKNLTKEWEQVSSKSLSISEVMKNLSKKQPSSSVVAPIVVECAEDPFEKLDDLLGNSSTVDDVLELGMLFETEGVGLVGKFKEVEVDADNESEEESDTEGDYTMD
ncbi:hypothetical protein Tco_1472661, partial [Tanacetum coccineum]